ncbi:MAG: riboflavin biosynthesis protein RibF, partial [Candidatus Omnitrophica bacterium]|nr:riboflavin biosynthesis protein RibF [Candidatus Omnitrophota bacterium]
FDLSLLVSLTHRLRIIESLGVDVCMVVHFTKQLAKLTAQNFAKKYLVDLLNAKEIFIGKNFHFGKNRNGNNDILRLIARRYQVRVNILKSVCYQNNIVSSSRLRVLIRDGNLLLAKKYLGRSVSVFGQVVHGDGRGRRLGFPTVNINSGPEILPPLGVYIVEVILNGKLFQGVANIGHRPSFKRKSNKIIEAHIFNFNKNIYGRNIEIRFLRKIRDERKFDRPEDLSFQIEKDKKEALQYFSKIQSRKHIK